MKKFIFPVLLISMSSFANEQLCGIDYASINYVQNKQVIKTDSNYLVKAMEKIEKVCESKSLNVEKSYSIFISHVEGYSDGDDYVYYPPQTMSYAQLNGYDDDRFDYDQEEFDADKESEQSIEIKALVQVCYDTVLNLKAIQGSCGVDIALEIESALYNVQQFCTIAENENGYLVGYLDGIN